MKVLLDTEDFGITVGFSPWRWYFGAAYEPQPNGVRGVVFRFGPFNLVMVHRISQ